MANVDKSRVLLSGVTGQIPELLRIAVKHRHIDTITAECAKVCDRLWSRIVEASAWSGCSLVAHSVCIDFSYRWLACVHLFPAIS